MTDVVNVLCEPISLTWVQGGEVEGGQSSGLDAEENMGISSPLYQIIDVVFDLRARGFLRRQVPFAALRHDVMSYCSI